MKRILWVSLAVGVLTASSLPALAFNQQNTRSAKASEATTAPVSLIRSLTDSTIPVNASPQSKIYQWSLKGRWGLKLDVNQDQAKPSGWNDVDAGAYFKISPSVRVGGSVGFGEKSKPLQLKETESEKEKQPRVRLETTFKF
jgi:hypothetical protein